MYSIVLRETIHIVYTLVFVYIVYLYLLRSFSRLVVAVYL